jgi:hypothetical protein
MARSESQGLQIAVILLTMCVVGLAISTWVYYQAADTSQKAKESAENTAKDAQKATQKEAYKYKTLALITGLPDVTKEEVDRMKAATGGDPTVEGYLDKYNKVMLVRADKAVTGEAKGLAALPDYLVSTSAERNKALAESQNRENVLNVEKKAIDTRETGRTATAQAGMDTAVKDLSSERDQFNKNRQDFEKALKDLKDTVALRDKQLKELKEKADKENNDSLARIGSLQKDLEKLREKLLATTKDGPSFEAPDGQITWVNQRQRLAWIDVGYADGLTRQSTFSVYDHDENGVSSAKRKARIEVIRVVESHLSECRITEDEVKNPILPGDKIFSPAWSPGQHLHFAINGGLDINGDGRPDNDEVRSIIELNGGVVDGEVKPDGSITGTINIQTRYLIRGKPPSEKDFSPEEGKKAYTNWSEMTEKADKYGVEIIDISRFLNQMGWKAQEKTTALGSKRTTSKRSAPAGKAVSEDTTEEAPADEKPAKPAKPATPAKEDDDPFGS